MSPNQLKRTSFGVLAALSVCHLLNDMMQALLAAVYPMLKSSFNLEFWQIGVITLANQVTASLLQPFVGHWTDRRPKPYLLAAGMGSTLVGLLLLSKAHAYPVIVSAAALIGVGSSIFHPESSRIARIASGGKHGLAQSLFQTGGNAGTSLGPLMAAFIVLPRGQDSIAWFSLVALLGMVVLWNLGGWFARVRATLPKPAENRPAPPAMTRRVKFVMAILLILTFSKMVYLSSFHNYYTFFLIQRFGLSVRDAQLHLFMFLAAVAAGTFAGGPLGDRFGRKFVIWISILGVLPFSLGLPYANLFWTEILTVIVGLVLSSAFSAILVYGQDLLPGRVGLVAGLFFGVAFGVGGIAAAVLGRLADATSIEFVYRICSFLPALGLLAAFLPDLRRKHPAPPPTIEPGGIAAT